MITRLWRGWARTADADAYQALLRSEIVEGIVARQIPGFLGIDVLRRDAGEEVEFVTVMRFEHRGAVEAFAGPDSEQAVVPPAARRLLSRFEERTTHYETVLRREP